MSLQSNQLAFRPFAERDFDPLARIMAQTWLSGLPARAAATATGVELCEYAATATWSRVCERADGGELLGAVLVAQDGTPTRGADAWAARRDALLAEAAGDPETENAVRLEMAGVREEDALAAEYRANGGPEAQAAIKLLIVSPGARGLGLGRRLLDLARGHLRERGCTGYHLMTDDSCDVSFYDHLGLTRARRRRSRVEWPGTAPGHEGDDCFIYVYADRL